MAQLAAQAAYIRQVGGSSPSTPTMNSEQEKAYENDAWFQKDQLLKRTTKKIEVRSDLIVTAVASDRRVDLTIVKEVLSKDFAPKNKSYTVRQANTATMRELAQAIIDACDFVEDQNPEWSKGMRERRAEEAGINETTV